MSPSIGESIPEEFPWHSRRHRITHQARNIVRVMKRTAELKSSHRPTSCSRRWCTKNSASENCERRSLASIFNRRHRLHRGIYDSFLPQAKLQKRVSEDRFHHKSIYHFQQSMRANGDPPIPFERNFPSSIWPAK